MSANSSIRPASRCPWPGAQHAAAAVRLLARWAVVTSSSLVLLSSCPLPCGAEEVTFKFAASPDPERRAAQETLVEAWAYSKEYFLDADMNGLDWDAELKQGLAKTFSAESIKEAYKVTPDIIQKLGDPFTRAISPEDANRFLNAEKGQVAAAGMQVAATAESDGGRRVVAVIAGSPAEREGILPGDVLLLVNGRSVDGMSGDEVATALQDKNGAQVVLSRADGQRFNTRLRLENLTVSPVQYAPIPWNPGSAEEDGFTVGYIRLATFSENAPAKVKDAVTNLQTAGASAFILDLRDNQGGGLQPGYKVAGQWLRPGEVFTNVTYPRADYTEEVHMEDDAAPLTSAPLVVLVNGGTASVSELMAGALHDNGRALLIGEKTFGKGRTQRVIPLKSGWLLLVSNTRFTTPAHHTVDKTGLEPDIICKPKRVVREMWRPGLQDADSLLQDPCIKVAAGKLSSTPR